MKVSMSGVAILVAAVWSGAVAAQSGATMAKGETMSKMEMKDTTYTGCIEAGSTDGSFTLTHLSGNEHMAKDNMAKDTMAKEDMGMDPMTPATVNLVGAKIDLRKYLGHKVSVTGSLADEKMDATGKGTMGKATSTFTVKSLKMVAASCS